MTDLPIPLQVLYAGLGGTVLALIVASIQNKWSCRVFFILALRLAIGWHFLFEGLHKIHSHYVGPGETNKVFTSEPYFAVAEGPLGPVMRKQLGDPEEQLKARLTPRNIPELLSGLSADDRAKLALRKLLSITDEDYAKLAPTEVVKDWQGFVAAFTEKYKLGDDEKAKLDGQLSDAEKKELDSGKGPGDLSVAAMASYAKWAIGVEARNSKVKFVSGDTPLTAPQRLEYIKHRQKELDDLQERAKAEMGNGQGIDMTRLKDAKTLVSTAKTTLLSDADAYLAELEKEAFTAIMVDRLAKAAPMPSKVIGSDDGKFGAVLPPPAPTGPVSFEAVPEPVRKLWDTCVAAYKADYPDAAGEKLDEAYALAKARFTNWYFDRDEFSGRPKPGFTSVAGKYSAAVLDAARLDGAVKDAKDAGPFVRLTLTAAADAAWQKVTAARFSVLVALDLKYAELKKSLDQALPADAKDGPLTTAPTTKKEFFERLDRQTRWGIAAIGAMLLAGLFTRVACLAGAAFLVLTYLTHPPFPWLPLPPGTEGNPVFVNKNVIEFLGLMVILVHPTGRWMGLDAIIHRLVFRRAPDPSA